VFIFNLYWLFQLVEASSSCSYFQKRQKFLCYELHARSYPKQFFQSLPPSFSLPLPLSILPELNLFQHGLAKSESIATSLVTFLYFVAPSVCSQDQTNLFM
jgi:hypothetical protein